MFRGRTVLPDIIGSFRLAEVNLAAELDSLDKEVLKKRSDAAL
jgi:hypothetical protein